jgi:hypothetical protein
VKLTKTLIDALLTPQSDVVYWDAALPGFGRVTLHHDRVAAQKVFAARLDGHDPAAEKRDRVEDLPEAFIDRRLSQNRSGAEIGRLLRRDMGRVWAGRSAGLQSLPTKT